MKTVLLTILLVAATFPVPCRAQNPQEDLAEIDVRLREAEYDRELLQLRLQQAELRIKLLTEARKLHQALQRFEPQIEQAEAKQDERGLRRLQAEAEEAELALELNHARLEILERRRDLADLLGELNQRDLQPLQREAKLLLKLTGDGGALVEQFFKSLRDGNEEQEAALEEKIEELEATFEHRRDVLQLKLELHWAREEGEAEAVGELEAELKELGELPGDEAGKGLQPDQSDLPNRPLPIELTAEEIADAGKFGFDERIAGLLKASCFECHDRETASGDLNLEDLIHARPLVVKRSHWLNVIQQIKVRSMPPTEADQPTEADRRVLAAWLTGAIENFDYSTVRQPGYEPARRLTHDEYNHTIRDLVGIDIRPADRFPADLTATSGFENSANSLFLQPITLERYIGAAESIAAAAWPEQATTADQRTAWRLLMAEVTDLNAAGAVESVLRKFASRAYRRPVESTELTTLVAHFQQRVEQGASTRGALADVLQVMLVSPNFLIRTERDGPASEQDMKKAFRITDWELASRLSYFLWASMPDDALFRLAEANTLHDPEVLAAQVDRMLVDPKAETLGRIFASQWLGFTDLGRVRPGQIDNPWATDSLIAAMQLESAMLFNSIVRDNLPLDRLIDADYTFVNAELAAHYQMPKVTGGRMRRVSLLDTPRRGILGHGSILAVTSFPGRTSPVLRGNWVLTKLLGTPPPPPPPNVSEFDERVARQRRLTQRQKLELHRSKANCYACHSQIDPLGFAMEEFEWFGRHRPARGGKPVDARGALPDGTTFQGLRGLGDALLAQRVDDLTTQLSRKMLSYALGRQLEYYDEATVGDLVGNMRSHQRRLQSLIHAIVQSDTFQMKQKF